MADIRVLETPDQLLTASALFRTAMVGLPPLPLVTSEQIVRMREPGNTLGAYIDDRMVGTVESATSELVVPGGARLPHAPITRVGVLPEFTRRGIVSSLLTRQLRDSRDRGLVLATLRASEATIYGRFGYGVATHASTLELNRARAVLRESVPRGGPVRHVEAAESWPLVRRIFADHPSGRPGFITRPDVWWAGDEIASSRASGGPNYVAVHGEPGAENGFVRYHAVGTDTWFTSDKRTIIVDDLHAPTTEAYVGLLRFLLNLDLVDVITFATRPIDDPLPYLLADRRAVRVVGVGDETWLRILDVPAALSARTYSGDRIVAVQVTDSLLEDNSGVYRIARTGVERVDETPDLTVDVRDLASVFLGEPRWHQLAAAGTVIGSADALDAAADLFSSRSAPHCGTDF